jgi:peptidoglycan hydrolase-like protein with peptidoglycan-binding domain
VLAFQQQHAGLEVDGLVGPATMTALFAGAPASAEV